MPCETRKLPGGQTAIVCGPRRRPKKCGWCAKPSTKLCDFLLPKGYVPGGGIPTCDKPMCDDHADHRGPNLDYCPAHAAKAVAR